MYTAIDFFILFWKETLMCDICGVQNMIKKGSIVPPVHNIKWNPVEDAVAPISKRKEELPPIWINFIGRLMCSGVR